MADTMGSMIEFSQNLKDAEAPEALPPNDYPGEITVAEYKVSASSGKPMVDVTFRIKPEDFPADYPDADAFADGKQLHFYLGVADDKLGRFRVRKFLEAIGVKLGAKTDVNDWVGKVAMLTITNEEFEGVDRERVSRVSSL